jgi:hypothetical protein
MYGTFAPVIVMRLDQMIDEVIDDLSREPWGTDSDIDILCLHLRRKQRLQGLDIVLERAPIDLIGYTCFDQLVSQIAGQILISRLPALI